MEDDIVMIGKFNSQTWLSQALPQYRTAMAMVGVTEGIETAYGKCYVDKETESENSTLQRNLIQSKVMCFNKMYIAFMFRRFSTTKELAEIFFRYHPRLFTFLVGDMMNIFYGGLVSFWVARKTEIFFWFKQGEMALSTFKGWAESSQVCRLKLLFLNLSFDAFLFSYCENLVIFQFSQWNFLNKLQLLEAEKYYCLRDIEKAKFFYNASISSATNHKFIHEEALSCELAGYFFSEELGQADLALSYFMRAHNKYTEWGAFAKVNALFQFINGSIGASISASASTVTQWTETSGEDSNVGKRSYTHRYPE